MNENISHRKTTRWAVLIAAAACILVVVLIASCVQTPKTEEMAEPVVAEDPVEEAEATHPEDPPVSEENDLDENGLPDGLVARRIDDGTDDPLAISDFDPDAGFSDMDIEDIVTVLQMRLFRTLGSTDPFGGDQGYRTDSTQLEVAGPFPWYYLKANGKLGESPSEFCIVFDDGEPIVLIIKSRVVGTYHDPKDDLASNVRVLSTEGDTWNGHPTTTLLARIKAGSTEFAMISGDDETVLVDGDGLYEIEYVAQSEGLHPIYFTEFIGWESYSDRIFSTVKGDTKIRYSPVDLRGLVLGSLNNRQTFEYQSPE